MKNTLFLLLFLAISMHTLAQTSGPLRIATYNLLNYPGANAAARDRHFRTIMATMRPDVLVAQEVQSQEGVVVFLQDVLNALFPGRYAAAPFNDGPDSDNSFFYNSGRVTFLGVSYIPTALRDIAEYRFATKESNDTIRIFSVHLKASQSEEEARFEEAKILSRHLDALPENARFIVAGDFNVYGSSEAAYQELTNPLSPTNRACVDPLDAPGEWSGNAAFAAIHTQSPRVRQFEGGSNGGMDDRFDMLLLSPTLAGAMEPGSYTAYGNDGMHFNDSINRLPNGAVPDSVADALHYASDHLPVFADFVFDGQAAAHPLEEGAYPRGMEIAIAPQPSSGEVMIDFTLDRPSRISMRIFNSSGQIVATPLDARLGAGRQHLPWDGSGEAAGIYICEIRCGDRVAHGRIVHVR